jgi:translation initiation factor 2-alpha kinase 4
MVYLADPVCDDINTTLPLELFVVTFQSRYYTTSQGLCDDPPKFLFLPNVHAGRKKLKQVEAEIQRLTAVHHPNLTSVFAVKLTQPNSSRPSQLMVLSEQAPVLTLQDVLEDCDSLRAERASVRVVFVIFSL